MTNETTVVAQGTFDILHPGHLHYLEEAAGMGDELIVIISRRPNVDHKDAPILVAEQRRAVVDALEVVDHAILGNQEDIFVPIEEIKPDVIAIGHDQHHEPEEIESALERRGLSCSVRRTSGREPALEGELLSTRQIIDRIVKRRRSTD